MENNTTLRAGNKIVIREMKQGDIMNILEIEKLSFASPWTKGMLKETLSSPIAANFVMATDKILVGYIMVYSVEDEAHILNLAAHPDHRRRGYASRLIRHTVDRCRDKGVSEFFLEVRESNNCAKTLYRKIGFEVIGRRKRYYTETNEDALVMQLSLHSSCFLSAVRSNEEL